MADDAGRGSDSDGGWGDGAADDGVGTNNGTVADGGAGEDADAVAEPDVAADDDLAGGVERSVGGEGGRIRLRRAGVEAVGVVGDEDVAAGEEAVADVDAMEAGDVDVGGEADVVAEDELGGVRLAGVVGDGFEPEVVGGAEVFADAHVGEAVKPRGVAGAEAGGVELAGGESVAQTAG
jgi:hypothetical protein